MNTYSKKSLAELETCHPDLQTLFKRVLYFFDHTILEGHRNKEDQDRYYALGNSQLKFPDGKHNNKPSFAVDAIPYPVDWHDRERMTYFAGQVIATARMLNIEIRWGGDWDRDTQVKDNKFDDLVHFELVNQEQKP